MTTDTVDPQDMFRKNFDNPEMVAHYADGMRRYVPGVEALHQMTGLLLAESAKSDARILVLGAGGGIELKALADAYPGWTFVGIDPALEMLRLAVANIAPHGDRVTFIEGYIDDAPSGPFDGAVCLLTLHFLPAQERARTIGQIHKRLRPGAPFVVAHSSFPQGMGERDTWLDRYAAYPVSRGADAEQVKSARAAVSASLNSFSPEQDEQILRDAGFPDLALFYAAFTWRGWVGHAA